MSQLKRGMLIGGILTLGIAIGGAGQFVRVAAQALTPAHTQSDTSVVATTVIPRGYSCPNLGAQSTDSSYPGCVVSSVPMPVEPSSMHWIWRISNCSYPVPLHSLTAWYEGGTGDLPYSYRPEVTIGVDWLDGRLQLRVIDNSGTTRCDVTVRYSGVENTDYPALGHGQQP